MQTLRSDRISNCTPPDLLHRCKAAVRTVVPNADLILYGSRARGDANDDSDYDVLVIVDGPVNMALEDRMRTSVYPLELETGAMITLIVYGREEWNSPLQRATPFHENVEREGVLL